MRLSPHASGGFGVLFAADFDDEDLPVLDSEAAPPVADDGPEAPPPAAIEPRHYTAADLADATRAGHDAGYAEGLAAAAESAAANRTALLALLSEQLAAARTELDATVSRRLDLVTDASLAMVAACLPVLCENAGTPDLLAVLADLLPSLVGEPELVVTVHPSQADAVARELGPVLGKNTPLQVQTSPSMGRSDVGVTWRSGTAKRDTRPLRREVAATLRRSLRASPAPMTNKEHRHGR